MAEAKPRYIVPSLEDFLKPGALARLTQRIDSEKLNCASLATMAKGTKVKAKKGETEESRRNRQKEANATAKRSKQQLAELSQRLVMSLVKMVEEEKLLKPAMSLHPTSTSTAGTNASGDSGVQEVVT